MRIASLSNNQSGLHRSPAWLSPDHSCLTSLCPEEPNHTTMPPLLRRLASTVASTASTASTAPKVVFSGIQPTGTPHLGNYLGALRQWVDIQSSEPPSTKLIFSIVDLHAITQRQDADVLRRWKKEMLAAIIAIGINPERSVLFEQSKVLEHAELMWILSCGASTGYLGRMTQWKVGGLSVGDYSTGQRIDEVRHRANWA